MRDTVDNDTHAWATILRRALRRTILNEWDLFVPDAAPQETIRTAPTTAITSALAGHLRPSARAEFLGVHVDCGYHRSWDLVVHRRLVDSQHRLLCVQVALAGDGDWQSLTHQATSLGYRSAVLLDLDHRSWAEDSFPITPRWRWAGQPSFSPVFEHEELAGLLSRAHERVGRMRARLYGTDGPTSVPTGPPNVVQLPRDEVAPNPGPVAWDEAETVSVSVTPTVDRRETVSAARDPR